MPKAARDPQRLREGLKAEIVSYDDLVAVVDGGGRVRQGPIEGKDYVMADGDVVVDSTCGGKPTQPEPRSHGIIVCIE